MRLKYTEGGKAEFYIVEFLEAIDTEDKLKLADSIACQDDVIKYVAQQIIDGWTEQVSHGSKRMEAEAEPRTGLDWATREVAKASGDVARKEIEELEKEVVRLKKIEDTARSWSMSSPRDSFPHVGQRILGGIGPYDAKKG